MAFKVMLYSIADEFSHPEYQSPLSATKDDTYATFRGFLEGEGLVDFAFDFWIAGDKKRMLPRFEKFNAIRDEVFVIPKVNVGTEVGKKRKVAGADEHDIVLNSEGNAPDFPEIEAANNGNAEPTQPASSSRVCGEADPTPETHLLSKLVPPEVMQ
jgi:hypothetical protein